MSVRTIIQPKTDQKLKLLIRTLFLEGYFELDSAIAYVQNIYDFIERIPAKRHKKTGSENKNIYYCRYDANNHTSWFIIFDIKDERFIIRNVFNNHSPEYPKFIKTLR